MTPEPSAKKSYRPDIDGLRAIAVISVVLYHLRPSFLPGGFVGVDIFFVISGFLITGHLEESLRDGHFSLASFYSRRIRRILPSLAIVLGISFVAAWFLLFSSEFKIFSKSLSAACLFWSNIFFARQAGYFDTASDLKPLLHIWSLSIEEQFYFLWPLLLWFLPTRHKVKTIALVCFFSLVCAVIVTAQAPAQGFFLLPSRFWELAGGGLLALTTGTAANEPESRSWGRRWANGGTNYASVLGLFLLAVAIFNFSPAQAFPGWRALLPNLGALLLIFAGPQAWVNRRILSNSLFVYVGLISYPLYLWHWPLLSFLENVQARTAPLVARLVAVLVAVILASLCYHWIEKPVRGRGKNLRSLTGILLGILCGLAALGFYGGRVGNSNTDEPSAQRGALTAGLTNSECALPSKDRHLATWCLSDKRETARAVIVGDSHAEALYPGLLSTYHSGQAWTLMARRRCPPVLDVYPADSKCAHFNQAAVDSILAHPELQKIVIVGAARLFVPESGAFLKGTSDRAVYPFADLEKGLARLIQVLQKSGRTVALLLDPPAITDTPELCLPRPHSLGSPHYVGCSITRAQYDEASRSYRDLVNRLAQSAPGLIIVDATNLFCDTQTCSVMHAGKSYYSYSDHISDGVSGLIGERILRSLFGPP